MARTAIVRFDSLEDLRRDFVNRFSDLSGSIKPENSIISHRQCVVPFSCSEFEVHAVIGRGECNRERRRLLIASLHPNVTSSEEI